jgi:hypothetical protein
LGGEREGGVFPNEGCLGVGGGALCAFCYEWGCAACYLVEGEERGGG